MEDQTFTQNPSIGYVIGGGLEANLDVRLTVPPQEVQEGAFVVIDSNNWRFYGLVTDLRLTAIDEQYANQLSSSVSRLTSQNTSISKSFLPTWRSCPF